MIGALIHFGYVFLILSLIAYLLWAPRKELPFVLVLHGVVQYGASVGFWLFSIGPAVLGKVLIGIYLGTALIWWARSIGYGPFWRRVYATSAGLGWLMMTLVVVWISMDGLFQYQEVSPMWREVLAVSPLAIHPLFKWLGNVLIFLTFFQITLHWGQPWKPVRSWLTFGPLLLFFLILLFFSLYLTGEEPAPFT